MKGIIFTAVFVLSLVVLSGCYTIPRHYTYQEEIVYYSPPDVPPPTYYPDPPMPNPPVLYPSNPKPNPPRDRQPDKPSNSYHQRDPLQGGSDRGRGEIKTDPPVRNPQQKDQGHE